VSLPRQQQPFVAGSVTTGSGTIPRISATLTSRDHWGAFKVRWGIKRMDYRVDPGLYALGSPDRAASVFVTANYKLSFDCLRESLHGRSAWILVLDTKGINVWCSAGKGTFGTDELVDRIKSSGLAQVVDHRVLILPQLAGPGVAAHAVKKLSGFEVVYGPIRATDLPAFLDAGKKATRAMRRGTFTTKERIVLIPVELVSALKTAAILAPVLYLLGGLGGPRGFWANASIHGSFAVLCLLSAIVAGCILAPLLLPWVPGRAFSLKGLILGMITALIVETSRGLDMSHWSGSIESAAWLLLIPAISAYLAMNFTGASTYTSLSGVKKEMRWALPLEIAAGVAGLGLWLVSRFVA